MNIFKGHFGFFEKYFGLNLVEFHLVLGFEHPGFKFNWNLNMMTWMKMQLITNRDLGLWQLLCGGGRIFTRWAGGVWRMVGFSKCSPTCQWRGKPKRVPFAWAVCRTERVWGAMRPRQECCECTAFFPFKLGASPPQKKFVASRDPSILLLVIR